MQASYEWSVEITDEFGDIQDSHFSGTLKELDYDPNNPSHVLVLVRSVGDDYEGVIDRQWAYPESGELPETFDGGNKIPQRYYAEYSKNQ